MSSRFNFFCGLLVWLSVGVARPMAGEPVDVARLLHQWQTAAQGLASPSVEDEFSAYSESHSAHEREAAAAFCGPVSARELARQFEWTATLNGDGATVLTAAPRDPLHRLFFTAVEIDLNPQTHLPQRFWFRDLQNKLRAAAILAPGPRADGVVTAAAGTIQLASLVEFADAEQAADTPQTAEILAAWAAATRSIERAEIDFVRYEYDHIESLEKRSEGRFHFERPDRGLYERRATGIAVDTVSRRSREDGTPYRVAPDSPSMLCWDNQRVIIAYPGQQAYDEFPLPRASSVLPAASFTRQWYSLAAPQTMLPATVDVHSSDFLQRFEWALLDHDEQRLVLQGRPLSDEDQLEVFELQVVLDPKTYLAQATRSIPADRHREIVHVIRRFDVNDAAPAGNWRPDLSSFRKYDPAPLAPPAEEE
jgi:hypothetical protein